MTQRRVLATYYAIAILHTLGASLIWGINTLFLLHAGLDIFEVFLVSATHTAGIVVFEIPTGVVADLKGRRTSLLCSAASLFAATSIYVAAERAGAGVAVFGAGALLLGLGATFYSGAVEAWVVDSLAEAGYRSPLERVLARGQLIAGAATVAGTVAGGLLASLDLAWPYVLRGALLVVLFVFAFSRMGERARAPLPSSMASGVRRLSRASLELGWRRPAVRGLLFAGLVQYGFLVWAFHAWQPYFLKLLGRDAPWVAGVVSALVTLATMAGNALADRLASPRRGVAVLLWASAALTAAAAGVGLAGSFVLALALLLATSAAWGLVAPVKQACLHRAIPSDRRATLISLDSLVGNAGAVAGQSGLGYLARTWSIAAGYVVGGLATAVVLPVLLRLRRRDARGRNGPLRRLRRGPARKDA